MTLRLEKEESDQQTFAESKPLSTAT